MLAMPVGAPFDDSDWLFETKWDGVHAIATIAMVVVVSPYRERKKAKLPTS